jgi:hypothetical protein
MSTLYGLYDFVSEHDDEISFKVNEPIVVIEADSDYMDGWWLVRRNHDRSKQEGTQRDF